MGEIIEFNPSGVDENNVIVSGIDQEDLVTRVERMLDEISSELPRKAYFSMPVSQLSSLGAGVASLLPAFQSVIENMNLGTETLYRVVNADIGDALKVAKNGNLWGALKTVEGKSKMAQLQAVNGVKAATGVAAVNPAVIMVAVALFAIEQQIGKIVTMQKEIISFLEVEKEAEIESDLKTLGVILSEFKYSWDNELFIKSNHKLVLDIKRTANKNLIGYQKKVDESLSEQRRIVVQSKVGSSLQILLKKFQYYKMSLFIAAMASLLDVMLSGNFKEEYISGIKSEIEAASTEYRERFTKCSGYLEKMGESSVQKQLKSGLGSAGIAAGKVIEKIPLVEKGPVDEYLQKAGKSLKTGAEEMVDVIIQQFSLVRDPGTSVFAEKLEDLIQIYNHTSEICFDGKKLHLIAS